MKLLKKIISAIMVAVMLITAAPLDGLVGLDIDWSEFGFEASAADELATMGQCGDDVRWMYSKDTGSLVIAGQGDMWGYDEVTTPFREKYILEVEIDNGVTSIGENAFYNCNELSRLEIPDSVTSIGVSAFSYCYSLTSIEIPDSVTSIGGCAFWSCDSLTSVKIPDSVTSIGDYAFWSCDSLTSVKIGNSVTSIGEGAFSYCYSLTSIEIPDGVTNIGSRAFYSCDSLTSIEIPDSVTSIGDYAFYDCDSLTSVEIPDSVTSIGAYAFRYCDSLTDVYYGGSEAEWNEILIGIYNSCLTGANIHFNSSMPGEDEGYKIYTLHTFASQPRLVFGYGDAMSMAFELECFDENGRYYLVEDVNFTLTSSDTDIFYIEDIDKDGETTTARIVSENPGTAILTVGAYVDGEYITSSQFYITVEGEQVYHMDSLSDPDINTSDCKIISNNFVAENFKCDEYEETCAVTFDIYNRLNCLGAVEVYDSKGGLVETKSVSEYGGLLPTGLWDATKMMFDFTSLKENSYKDETYSKKTSISLSEVPKDGYIKITFDSAESEVVAFYNASSLIVDAVLELLTLETSDEVKEEVIKTATEEITDKCLASISADKQLKKYADKILTKYCQSLSVGEVGEIKNALEGVLYLWDTLEVDYKKIIADVLKGMIESVWETVMLKLAGTVGEVVEKLFDAIKTYNMINQAQTLEKMRNSKGTCIYVEKDRKTQLYSNGYYVKQNDSFENGVSFHKYKIVSGDTYYQAMSEFADEEYIDVISMSLFRNGKEVQPNGQVEVAIPLPEGMNIFNIRVYRYEEDTGKFTRLECDVRDIDNGYIYVKTEHFSVYCIVADTTEATEVEIENKNCYIGVDDLLLPEPLFKPFDCIAPEYRLISSNENVAKVTNEGAVIGVGLGCAEITLTTENGLSAVFKVNVVNDCYFNGHISDNGTVIKNSTCSEEGIIEYLCTICGDSYTEAIPVIEHSYNAVVTAPTCTAKGYTTYTCACGDTYVSDYVAETDHNYNNSGICTDCGADRAENCSCNCHKDGFIGFIWKILRFFYKLFGTNRICDCGISHY